MFQTAFNHLPTVGCTRGGQKTVVTKHKM